MALADTRMKIAVRLVDRALSAGTAAGLDERLAGFQAAYGAIAHMSAGDEAWSEDVLSAAWTLVEDAYADGGPVDELATALGGAFAVLADVVAPPARQPSKPRRDA